jgi:hypothetical protein
VGEIPAFVEQKRREGAAIDAKLLMLLAGCFFSHSALAAID